MKNKTKYLFIVSILIVVCSFKNLKSQTSEGTDLGYKLTLKEAQGLDWAVARVNKEHLGETNWVNIQSIDYGRARVAQVFNSFVVGMESENKNKLVEKVQNIPSDKIDSISAAVDVELAKPK